VNILPEKGGIQTYMAHNEITKARAFYDEYFANRGINVLCKEPPVFVFVVDRLQFPK